MVIAHNISAINTYNKMGVSATSSDKSMEKLSSGYKINRASDDAAGLSISEKMRSQIRGLNQASENAQNGISMIQTAEGALNEAHSICQRMRELAVQAANDTNAASDREALQSEMNQLTSEINRIGNTTEFNGMKLLNGSKITTNGKEQIEIVGKTGTPKIATNFSKVSGVTNSAELKLTQPIKLTEQSTDSINYASLANAENKNVITLSKKDGKITASAKLEDSNGMTATYENLELIQDSDSGDWICKKENNHGIEFAISKDSAQAFITNGEESDTARVDLYLTKGSPAAAFDGTAGSYNLINDYLDGTGKNIAIQEDSFSLTGWNNGAARVDYDDVKIELQNATGAGKATLNVTFYSEGNVVIQDKLGLTLGALSGTTQTITYNANGITFKIDAADGTGASEYMGIDIDLTKYYEVEKVEGNGLGTDNSVYFHVGANTNQVINTTFGDMRAKALGLTGTDDRYTKDPTVNNGSSSTSTEKGLNISTRSGANTAIDVIDNAITKISEERSKYGAIQNRLEYTINNVDTTSENMTSAESTIRDVDMASEMMELTKNQILQQASQAMLSQAMQRPQQVLQLLQG